VRASACVCSGAGRPPESASAARWSLEYGMPLFYHILPLYYVCYMW
jgi:hypothetical protein